jgi:hypothetical protein
MATIDRIDGFSFVFDEPGGTSHLLPGRPLEQTRRVDRPPGSGFAVWLSSFSGSFVSGTMLRQRPLGQFRVSVGIRDTNVLVCRVRLTDENMDDPVRVRVGACVMFLS